MCIYIDLIKEVYHQTQQSNLFFTVLIYIWKDALNCGLDENSSVVLYNY